MSPLAEVSLNAPLLPKVPMPQELKDMVSEKLFSMPLINNNNSAEQPVYTRAQKDALINDLELELSNAVAKLRAQYQLSAAALKSKIESRINRVPKRLWGMTLGDLSDLKQQPVSPLKRPARFASGGSGTGRVTKNTNLNTLAVPRLRASPVKVSQVPSKSGSVPGSAKGVRTGTRNGTRGRDSVISPVKNSPVKSTLVNNSPVKRATVKSSAVKRSPVKRGK